MARSSFKGSRPECGVRYGALVAALCLAWPALADISTDGTIDYGSEWTGPGVSIFFAHAGDLSVAYPNTGYDIQTFLCYTDVAGALYIGIDTVGIAGDADGNDNPGWWGDVEDPETGNNIDPSDYGWRTTPDGYTTYEAFGVLFDMDLNGTYDYVAGISPLGSYVDGPGGYPLGLYEWEGGGNNAVTDQTYWGDQVATGFLASPSPSAAARDIEFGIAGFRDLVALVDAVTPWDFNFEVVNGADGDPLGEDHVSGHVPEPGTLGLGALVGVALLVQRRRRRVTTA